jgi:alkanesulfonate monooxygenase SsuD/methylene tetrahydromethanopterin reductase-like flavin-dependent oxidoreductase (luciferase family)
MGGWIWGWARGLINANFDRLRPGLSQKDGWKYLQEMLPLIPKLWAGDVEHNGEFWQFPTATSCPKPVQDSVPIWVAARSPTTFDHAVGKQLQYYELAFDNAVFRG